MPRVPRITVVMSMCFICSFSVLARHTSRAKIVQYYAFPSRSNSAILGWPRRAHTPPANGPRSQRQQEAEPKPGEVFARPWAYYASLIQLGTQLGARDQKIQRRTTCVQTSCVDPSGQLWRHDGFMRISTTCHVYLNIGAFEVRNIRLWFPLNFSDFLVLWG